MDEVALRREVLARLEDNVPFTKRDRWIDRFRGCLIGGAIGDALGAPIEFMSRKQILQSFGPDGLTDFAPAYGKVGAITDDTQMSLFTGEGLLRAFVRTQLRGIGPVYVSVTDYAYARWLITQDEVPGFAPATIDQRTGWLGSHPGLFSRRAPGVTCLSSLRDKNRAGTPAQNDSKGCGGVMRVAPVGLFCAAGREESSSEHDARTFRLGCEIAGLTHGHITGQLPAGYLAVLIAVLASAGSWDEATERAWRQLVTADRHEETSRLIDRALRGAGERPGSWESLASLGEGWIAEEALAMSLYCAASVHHTGKQSEEAIAAALVLAVNHDGDSDSTGSITGNILGTVAGESGLPSRWQTAIELRTVIQELAEDLATRRVWQVGEYDDSEESSYWARRYPGG